MTTATRRPKPKAHFPFTHRLTAYEMAVAKGLHLVRDNFHLWAIRATDNAHVYIAHAKSYDGLWRAAVERFRDPAFDVAHLPYRIESAEENENQIVLYDPATHEERTIDRKDLTSRKRGSKSED